MFFFRTGCCIVYTFDLVLSRVDKINHHRICAPCNVMDP